MLDESFKSSPGGRLFLLFHWMEKRAFWPVTALRPCLGVQWHSAFFLKPCVWKPFGYNCHIRSDWKGIRWPVHLPHKAFQQTLKVNFVFIPYKSYLPKKNFLSQTLLMLYSRRCGICSELSEIPVSLSLEACLHVFWRHSPFPILNG